MLREFEISYLRTAKIPLYLSYSEIWPLRGHIRAAYYQYQPKKKKSCIFYAKRKVINEVGVAVANEVVDKNANTDKVKLAQLIAQQEQGEKPFLIQPSKRVSYGVTACSRFPSLSQAFRYMCLHPIITRQCMVFHYRFWAFSFWDYAYLTLSKTP